MSLLSRRCSSASASHWLLITYKTNRHLFSVRFLTFMLYSSILNSRSFLHSCDMKMFVAFSSATFFFVLISSIKAHTQGTVSVDTFTFDRILSKFDIVFVKFDDKFRMYF
jgi:hypothetical protein